MIARSLPLLALMALFAGCGETGGTATSDCGGGAHTKLQLARSGDNIDASFAVEDAQAGGDWRLVVVHEGHVTWRGTARSSAHGGVYLKRHLGKYPGANHVMVRATGPRGATCAAAATVGAEQD